MRQSRNQGGRLGQALSRELLDQWDGALENNNRATVFSYPDWLRPEHEREPESHFVVDLGHGVASCHSLVNRYARTVYLDGLDYKDIVAAPGKELDCVARLLEELGSKRRLWDICDFQSLAPFSSLLNVFAPNGVLCAPRELRPLLRGMSLSLIPYRAYSCVNLPQSWREFEKTLSPKMAAQLRAEQGRRDRNFRRNEIRLATEESFEEDIAALIELHQKRWTEKGCEGQFSNSDLVHQRCASLLRRNSLLLYTLWIEGRAVGALLCFSSGDRILHYTSGFDTDFKKFRPVKVLLARAIQDGISTGKNAFDFIRGDEPYKDEWANSRLTNYRLLIARRNVMGAVATAAHKATSMSKRKKPLRS